MVKMILKDQKEKRAQIAQREARMAAIDDDAKEKSGVWLGDTVAARGQKPPLAELPSRFTFRFPRPRAFLFVFIDFRVSRGQFCV